MENRFGFKEFVLASLMVLIIITLFVAMKQFDRQWDELEGIRSHLREMTKETSRVRGLLEQGVGFTGVPSGPTAGPVFQRIAEVQQREDYAAGDTLVQAMPVPPDRLTPIISTDAYASVIQSYVLESLADRNPDTLEWEPILARDWQIIDNREAWQAYIDANLGNAVTEAEVRREAAFDELRDDQAAQQAYLTRRMQEGRVQENIIRDAQAPVALTITFQLRQGVHFSDGHPLTADDVVFTYQWIMNPEVEAIRLRVYYDPIKDVEKVNDFEVAFHFREPYFKAFDFAGGMDILPRHFYGQYSPSEFNRHPAMLLGSGPYRLRNPRGTRPQPGVPIELVRNERYWAERPAFDRLVWRVIEQDTSREQAFLNREVDSLGPTPEQYDRLRTNPRVMESSQSFEYLSPASGYNYIGWNQLRRGQPTPFADVRVRRAMTMLLDRDRIAEEIYRGYAVVVSGPFSTLSPQSNPNIQPWPHDPTRARELLREAGYVDRSGDGVLQGPDGRPFAFTLNFPAGSDVAQQVSMFARDSYRSAGIDVTVQPLEWQVLIERLKNTRDFDAVTLGWSGTLEGDPYQIFHSSTIPPPGDNAIGYLNPELDRLLETARMTTDESARMAMWHEVHRIMHEDQPYTFMMARKSLSFFDNRIHNIRRTQIGLNALEEWYVPAELQRR